MKNADKGTIKSLNCKFKSAINKINPENLLKDNKDLWILFFIVILDKKETKHKQLSFSRLDDKSYIEKLFPTEKKDDWKDDWKTQNIT